MSPTVLLSVVGLVLTSWVRVDCQSSPCQPSLQAPTCLQETKNLLMDVNRFWFGTNFSANCSSGSTARECRNGDREHMSIMTRLTQTNIANTNNITQVLSVTYQVPAGSYMACGNTYQVNAVTNTIDPTRPSNIPLWSADHQPQVTWTPASANQRYSLIVWDAGALILHGMFFNILGSDLSNAQVAYNYRGPKNPVDRDQPYVFLLYTQTAALDPKIVMNVLMAALSSSVGTFAPIGISNALVLGVPVGVSVLTVRTDPFAAGYMKDNKIVNNCPAMLTPAFTALPLAYVMPNMNLTASVDVTYKSPELSLKSCCQDVTFVANTRMANPMGNGHISPVYARQQPHVTFQISNYVDTHYFLRTIYTLLMLDVTEDLDPNNSSPNTLVHWQVLNIREGDVMSGDTTLTYQGPLPLTGGGDRVFMFLLLRQMERVNATGLNRFVGSDCPSQLTERCRFNATAFISEFSMTIDGASWFMTSSDAYTRSEVIRLGLQNKMAACSGVQGYADPCPSTTCGASFAHASVVGIVMVALAACLRLFL